MHVVTRSHQIKHSDCLLLHRCIEEGEIDALPQLLSGEHADRVVVDPKLVAVCNQSVHLQCLLIESWDEVGAANNEAYNRISHIDGKRQGVVSLCPGEGERDLQVAYRRVSRVYKGLSGLVNSDRADKCWRVPRLQQIFRENQVPCSTRMDPIGDDFPCGRGIDGCRFFENSD